MRKSKTDKLFGDWESYLLEKDVLYGYRTFREFPEIPSSLDVTGTEGRGQYIAKTKKLADFFGKSRRVKFKQPNNALVVNEEPLYILHEEDELMAPYKKSDSEWARLNKLAVKKSEITDENWGNKLSDLQDQLTREILKAGYDSVYVKLGDDEWVVLLDKRFAP